MAQKKREKKEKTKQKKKRKKRTFGEGGTEGFDVDIGGGLGAHGEGGKLAEQRFILHLKKEERKTLLFTLSLSLSLLFLLQFT